MTVEIGAVGLDLDFCHWVRGGVKKNEGERKRKMSVRGKRKKKKKEWVSVWVPIFLVFWLKT